MDATLEKYIVSNRGSCWFSIKHYCTWTVNTAFLQKGNCKSSNKRQSINDVFPPRAIIAPKIDEWTDAFSCLNVCQSQTKMTESEMAEKRKPIAIIQFINKKGGHQRSHVMSHKPASKLLFQSYEQLYKMCKSNLRSKFLVEPVPRSDLLPHGPGSSRRSIMYILKPPAPPLRHCAVYW